ncbi:MAG: hypothetical protein J6W04_02105 [Bacteroidales bacterium]|nr:hypothetical protein [Bacteroidales bacterium]
MEARDILIKSDAPNVPIRSIPVEGPEQRRLVYFLVDNGMTMTDDLKRLSDVEMRKIAGFTANRLNLLKGFLTDWAEGDFVTKGWFDISRPQTVIASLRAFVFGNNRNMDIVGMRGYNMTYESIGDKYSQSRQSVQDKERSVAKKFDKWYEEFRVSERIGDFGEFRLYCEKYFPKDQKMMLSAIKRLIKLSEKKEAARKNELLQSEA